MLLRTKRAFRGPNSNTSSSTPSTDDPRDYGTVAMWYDPPAGSGTGYTLNTGNVTQLTDRSGNARHATPIGTGPTIASITANGSKDSLHFLNGSALLLQWTGTAVDVKAFAIVFKPTATYGQGNSSGYLFSWIDTFKGCFIGNAASSIVGTGGMGHAGVRHLGADNAEAYSIVDQTVLTYATSTVYVVAGRFNGTQWDIYINTTYGKTNITTGDQSFVNGLTSLVLGGRNQTTHNRVSVDMLQAVFFEVAPNTTNWNAYLTSLGTRFGITLATSAVTPPALTTRTVEVDEEVAEEINMFNDDVPGTNPVDVTSMHVRVAPTKGDASVNAGTGVITYTSDADTAGEMDSMTIRYRDNTGVPSADCDVSLNISGTSGVTTITPYMSEGIGDPFYMISNINTKLNTEDIRAGYSLKAPIDGNISAVGFQVASNQNSDENDGGEKSKGTGNITVNCKIYLGTLSAPDLSSIKDTFTIVHDRGSNGFNAANPRKWHTRTVATPFAVTAGQYVWVLLEPQDTSPSTSYISINSAGTKSGNRVVTPTPRLGPFWGAGEWGACYKENNNANAGTTSGTFQRQTDRFPHMEMVYDTGEAWGCDHFNQAENLTSATTSPNGGGSTLDPPVYTRSQIGGNRRIRVRWTHTGPTMDVRYCYFWVWYHTGLGTPTEDLEMTLHKNTGTDESPTWTLVDSATFAAASIPGWDQNSTTTTVYPIKFDMGALNEIENGETYKVEFSSDENTSYYRTVAHSYGRGMLGSNLASRVNTWCKTPGGGANDMAYVEYSTDGGANWVGHIQFSNNERDDRIICCFFTPS